MKQKITITLESKILNSPEIENILIQYCNLYSTLERKLFNIINHTENYQDQYNNLQKTFIKEYSIHARLFKTLWKQTTGQLSSIKSNFKNRKTYQKNKIKYYKNLLTKVEGKFKKYNIKNKINNLKQRINSQDKISRVWGGKSFYKKQWNSKDRSEWLEKWRIKRNHNFFIIGSSDETFGNSLCQLQNLQTLILILIFFDCVQVIIKFYCFL